MELFSLDSVILIIVTCNCLPFSGSRSIFRRHLITSAKNSVSEPPNLKIFWRRTPRDPPTIRRVPSALETMRPVTKKSSFGPVYASGETHLMEVCLVTLTVRSVCEREKEKRKLGTVHVTLSPLKQESDTCRGDLTVPDEFSTLWKIWPDTLFIRDFELLDVWFLCTVKVVPCEQKTLTHKLQPVEKLSCAVPCEHNSTIILRL